MKIVLVSCVKSKQARTCKASEMYTSFWFKSAYRYALEQKPDKIFILSAKYGLLEADEVIETYEKKLSNRTAERKLASFIDEQRMSRLYEKFILEYYIKEFPKIRATSSEVSMGEPENEPKTTRRHNESYWRWNRCCKQ